MTFGNILVTGPNGFEQVIPLGGTQLWIGSARNNDVVIRWAWRTAPRDRKLRPAGPAAARDRCRGCDQSDGGSIYTFDLAKLDRRRELTWIGDYVLSYQPATWDSPTQPLHLVDLLHRSL